MRWKAHFFMGRNVIECDKESFGFKSRNCPAQIKELEVFEKDLLDIIKYIKFRNINNKYQNLMKAHVAKVKASPNLSIPTDKTTNMYEHPSPIKYKKLLKEDITKHPSPTKYKKLLKDGIIKTYKTATRSLEDAINLEVKLIANCINLDDKI